MIDPYGAFVARGRIAEQNDGTLSGLSFVVKDNISVAGMPFTSGHPLFADRLATRTARAVKILLAAGAEFRGMTQTDAGGFGVTTPQTTNPVMPEYVVGGSSGGTAAAVAAGYADFGLGTDTAGSIRIPAACTGLFGFKPSLNAIAVHGIDPLAPSFDHMGLMAGDFATLARAAVVLLAAKDAGAGRIPARIRIGIDQEFPDVWHPETRTAFHAVCKKLAGLGHRLIELSLPHRAALGRAHRTVVLKEAGQVYTWCSDHDIQRLGEAAARALGLLRRAEPAECNAALALCESARASVNKAFEDVDLLLHPTLAGLPPHAGGHRMELATGSTGAVTGAVLETCLANILGTPVIAVPVTEPLGSLPFSIQIMAARHSDHRLLALAAPIVKEVGTHLNGH